jgi:N-sulfoglucosamine sulfohydrolase
LENDPYNLRNEVQNTKYKDVLKKLRDQLKNWMLKTKDLRAIEPQTTYWDNVLYTPDYQMKNYDLQKEVDTYKMLIPVGSGFKEVACE